MKNARKTMTSDVSEVEFAGSDFVVLRRSHLKESRKQTKFSSQYLKKPAREPICKYKIRYRDRREALEALHRLQNKREYSAGTAAAEARNEKRAYFCPTCKGAHLSSKRLLADPILKLVSTSKGETAVEWELAHVA